MDAHAVAGPSRLPAVAGYGQPQANGVTYADSHPGEYTSGSSTQHSSQDLNGMSIDPQGSHAVYHTSSHVVQATIRRLPTGYCYNSQMQLHQYIGEDEDDTHPESPTRIARIFSMFQDAGVIAHMKRIPTRQAVKEEATLVHTPELWDKINSFAVQPAAFFRINKEFFGKLSLYVNEHTAMCARLSLAGVVDCCIAVAEGKIQNAFAIVRPPGHHAEPERPGGFCFYNNAAVAAKYLKEVYSDIKKVLILDWDVHHGNGTQRAFWTDPDVLYMSIHRFDNGDFYPSGPFGGADMVGAGEGVGKCVNVPWSDKHMNDADYLHAFQKIIMPIAHEFAPDFVIISAGFDAADGDELGECHVTPAGYAHMTHQLSALANGKVVVALEGGYNVDAIAYSAVECVRVLLGEIPPQLPEMTACESATKTMHMVAQEQSKYWRCIQPTFTDRADEAQAGTIVPITEMLKTWRISNLYETYGMYNVTIPDERLDTLFKNQLLVSDNVFSAKTVVLFAHGLGNIRGELNALQADLNLEKTFLLDTSRTVTEWILGKGAAAQQPEAGSWGLIDVSVLAHSGKTTREAEKRQERDFVVHVWDHIVEMLWQVKVEHIILIGHAEGCDAITGLLNWRTESCMAKVTGVVQIFDMHRPLPLMQASDRPGLRAFVEPRSMAIFPSAHLALADQDRVGKRYGRVIETEEPRPSRLLAREWPRISQWLMELVERAASAKFAEPKDSESLS